MTRYSSRILISLVGAIAGLFFVSGVNAAAWDIGDATYSGNNISVSPATSPAGMFISSDGTKVYISNFSNQTIYQYSMSTGWDITTLTYDSKSKSVSAQGSPDDVALSADGTKMFILSFYDYTVRQYTLSTPWDITTASYDSVLLSLGSANHYDFSVKRDGTKLFSLNDYQNRIQQYSLSSAWDLSSQSAGSNYSYPSLSDGQELVFMVSDDGENMYIGTSTNERIHWFTLSTPWDTSTASYSGTYKSISAQDTAIRKIAFNPSGTIMLALGQAGGKLYEYELGDSVAPTVNSFSPADNATSVAVDSNLVITFSEAVDVESGNITIYKTEDDSEIEAIDVTSGQVTGTGTDTITVDPSSNFGSETEYYVLIDATAFDDAASNSFAGISDSTTWSFTSADIAAPTVSSLSPTDNATSVAVDSNLVINFNEAVDVESGNITIYKTEDDSEIEAIDVTSDKVTGTGTSTITVNPTDDLASETEYYVLIDATAFDDTSSNSFAGISDSTTWSFTTADTTNPTVSSFSPADNASDVSISDNITITFTEAVDVESGNITIKTTDGDNVFEVIDVTSDQVTGTGTTTITINPSSSLSYSTEYYVLIDSSAFDDPSSNSFTGISSTTTWSFTTAAQGSNSSGGGFVLLPVINSKPVANIGGLFDLGEINQRAEFSAYINSITKFQALVSSSKLLSGHELELIDLDMLYKKIVIVVKSEPQTIELSLYESKKVDLDNDGIEDIEIKFADLEQNEVHFEIENLSNEKKYPLDACDQLIDSSVKFGVRSSLVKRLQQFLNNSGFILSNSGYGAPGNETDYFGNLTKQALLKFQKNNDLNETGVLDENTLQIINCRDNEPKLMNDDGFIFTKDLWLGVSDPLVMELQKKLNKLGFKVADYGAGSPGSETNFFGFQTKQALIKYQLINNITPAFGYFGPVTRQEINK